ncbi:hypothetical protein OSB04_016099 [Centaurea solstitialis]|uniref:Cytochrome c oxidase assembly protein n=1 Tax=Centaurea solstitialis TaxID=347529 RepID=A0AA38T1W9_9ASTR|nr:hypothetical protein OSB04_016099 [Centaurea solstitialis]
MGGDCKTVLLSMSLARLYARSSRFSSICKTLNHTPLRSRCLLEPGQTLYNSVGASSSRHSQCCSEFRNFTSGSELSRKPFNRISHLGIAYTKTPYVPGSHRQYATNVIREQKSRKMLYYLTGLVFAMVGCTYASVPLYRRFCQATGYGVLFNGVRLWKKRLHDMLKMEQSRTGYKIFCNKEKENKACSCTCFLTICLVYYYREITVQFNADVSDGMPWKFIPTQREVRVKPGESALAFYTAENRSATPITGMSTYNVTPMKAAVYFNKIQCFCFEEQRLLPGEQIDMPVFFYIDPEFETDPRMDGIDNIILSYTFFKISEEKL